MALRVELPKELMVTALEQAISLRNRQITAATNKLIQEALEAERKTLTNARDSITEQK